MIATKLVNEIVNVDLVKRVNKLNFEEYLSLKEDDVNDKCDSLEKYKTREDYRCEFNQLKKWCSGVIANKGKCTREYISRNGQRFYSANSIQGISKHVKGFLFTGQTTDIDMVNSHPVILSYICKQNNILFPSLEFYNLNRDLVIDSHKDAKNLVISYINGSAKRPPNDFFKQFKKECKDHVHNKLIKLDKYKKFFENIESKHIDATVTFRIMEQMEVEIVSQVVIPTLEEAGHEVAVIMHDGAQFYGNHYLNENLLRTIELKVEEKFPGLGAKFCYKQHSFKFLEKISEPNDPSDSDNDNDNSVEEPVFFEDTETTYTEFKKDFEKKAFYCINLEKIVCHDFNDGYMTFCDPKDVSVFYSVGATPNYGHLLRYGEYVKKGKTTVFKTHLSSWIKEATKKCYDKIDFLPYPFNAEKRIYNIWKGFCKPDLEYSKCMYEKVVKVFEKFILHVGSTHANLPDFLRQYFGNIVQNPGMKEGILLIFTGTEGTFKGTLLRLFAGIIGREYVLETFDQDKVLGRFNMILMNKLLCSLNEAVSFEMIKSSGKIKALVTDTEMCYEEKCRPTMNCHNFTRFLICTNENVGAKDTVGGRRNVYIETSRMSEELRVEINEVINCETSCKILFDYLNTIKIKYKNSSEWSNARPITVKHTEIIDHFTDLAYTFIYELCLGKETKDTTESKYVIKISEMKRLYSTFMVDYPKHTPKTPKEMSLFITKLNSEYINNSQAKEELIKRKRGTTDRFYEINTKLLIDYLVSNKYVRAEDDEYEFDQSIKESQPEMSAHSPFYGSFH